MMQRIREKQEKQQHMYGTENILLSGCTTTGVQNYYQKSFGRPDNDTAWNSLPSGRFLLAVLRQMALNCQRWDLMPITRAMDEQLKALLEGINTLKSGQEETRQEMQKSQEETKNELKQRFSNCGA
ncbi:hypothetical protein TNCV_4532711 [Trichonephila clavipes]|nr:hypothetical protein TNCV_4532711 [Trichonephila clavipes]